MTLTENQAMRLHWALDLTAEALAMCNVPHKRRYVEIQKVANELLDISERHPGEPFPNSETELLWKNREASHWIYPGGNV